MSVSLYDIIKNWVETNFDGLIVELLCGDGVNNQIRINIAPGIRNGGTILDNSVAAIYVPGSESADVIYFRADIPKISYWNSIKAAPHQQDYFEILFKAINDGLKNRSSYIKVSKENK